MRDILIEATPKIAMLGGGSGSSTILGALKHEEAEITAVVNMSDDGGSTGKLREQYDVLPPGDLRQCLVALSGNPEASERFKYRYSDGELAGHVVGNLILARLQLDYDLDTAVAMAAEILDVKGRVLPVTTEKHDLVMQDGDEVIRGEFAVAYRPIANHNAPLYLDPYVTLHKEVEAALHEADLVVIAPGNLYGSLLPTLAVGGVAEAIRHTKARKLVVANLLNNPNQTAGWHVVDYVKRLEAVVGDGVIDDVLFNSQVPDDTLLTAAAKPGERPVQIDSHRFHEIAARAHGDDLVADFVYVPDRGDRLVPRSQIRHNAGRVAEHIMRLARSRE